MGNPPDWYSLVYRLTLLEKYIVDSVLKRSIKSLFGSLLGKVVYHFYVSVAVEPKYFDVLRDAMDFRDEGDYHYLYSVFDERVRGGSLSGLSQGSIKMYYATPKVLREVGNPVQFGRLVIRRLKDEVPFDELFEFSILHEQKVFDKTVRYVIFMYHQRNPYGASYPRRWGHPRDLSEKEKEMLRHTYLETNMKGVAKSVARVVRGDWHRI